MINQDGSMQMDDEDHTDGDSCAIYYAQQRIIMGNPITRALMTAVVSAAITCERRPQCGRVLDKRKAVSFSLVTGAGSRVSMVTCADCYDTHIVSLPDAMTTVSVTLMDVMDGRRLWPRNRHPKASV